MRKSLAKEGDKVYNQGMEGMERKKFIDHTKLSVASQEQINRLSRKFRKRGGEFLSDEATISYLNKKGAEAVTLDAYTILMRDKISISALLEELEHSEQYLRDENDGSPLSIAINEIAAKKKSISEIERYKLPDIEVEQVKKDIAYYEEVRRKIEDESH